MRWFATSSEALHCPVPAELAGQAAAYRLGFLESAVQAALAAFGLDEKGSSLRPRWRRTPRGGREDRPGRLRHASGKTTLDTYGHIWPDRDESTRATVDAVLKARAEQGGTRQGAR